MDEQSSQSTARIYSERLGPIAPQLFQAALTRFGLGTFVDAAPVTQGLFGQNVFVRSSQGNYVLHRFASMQSLSPLPLPISDRVVDRRNQREQNDSEYQPEQRTINPAKPDGQKKQGDHKTADNARNGAHIFLHLILARSEHFDVLAFAIFAAGYGPDNFTPFSEAFADH